MDQYNQEKWEQRILNIAAGLILLSLIVWFVLRFVNDEDPNDSYVVVPSRSELASTHREPEATSYAECMTRAGHTETQSPIESCSYQGKEWQNESKSYSESRIPFSFILPSGWTVRTPALSSSLILLSSAVPVCKSSTTSCHEPTIQVSWEATKVTNIRDFAESKVALLTPSLRNIVLLEKTTFAGKEAFQVSTGEDFIEVYILNSGKGYVFRADSARAVFDKWKLSVRFR